jgi:hypothetical protein
VLTSVSARQVEAKQTASPACSPPLGLSLGSPPLSLALPLSLTCDSVPLPVAPTQGLPQNLEGPGEEEVEEGAIQRVPTSDLVGSDSGLQQVRSLLQAELQAAPPGSYSAVVRACIMFAQTLCPSVLPNPRQGPAAWLAPCRGLSWHWRSWARRRSYT